MFIVFLSLHKILNFLKKKKIESYSLIISEIIHSKKCAYLNA